MKCGASRDVMEWFQMQPVSSQRRLMPPLVTPLPSMAPSIFDFAPGLSFWTTPCSSKCARFDSKGDFMKAGAATEMTEELQTLPEA